MPKAHLSTVLGLALAGDIIYVDAGTYSDAFISLSTSVSIIGAGQNATIFSSNNSNYLMEIKANNVIIKNLATLKYGANNINKGQVFDITGPYTGILFENITLMSSNGSGTEVYGNINIAGGASVTVKYSFFKC